jgi:uncharacterized membrane protein
MPVLVGMAIFLGLLLLALIVAMLVTLSMLRNRKRRGSPIPSKGARAADVSRIRYRDECA